MITERAFEMATASIRFGAGVTREIGMDLADWKVQRVMIVIDATLRHLPPVATVLESLTDQKISFSVFDRVRIEPSA